MSIVKKINKTSIAIVRTTNGEDKLMVDEYLYEIERRENLIIHWKCAKRNNVSCQARLTTTIYNAEEKRYKILRLEGKHNHEKFSVIRKPSQLPTTIQIKVNKLPTITQNIQVLSNLELAKPKQEPIEPIRPTTQTSNVGYEEHSCNENESDEDKEDDEEELNDEDDPAGENEDERPIFQKEIKYFAKFEENKVYVLRTRQNRELVCVNGYLFRLEAKSKTSATFRWECIRRDIGCKTRIYTEFSEETQRHTLRQLSGSSTKDSHFHDAYTPKHLSKLMSKHNISLISNDDDEEDESKSPSKAKGHAGLLPDFSLNFNDPLSSKVNTVFNENIFRKQKAFLIPTKSGKNILCLDNMTYRFDSRSPCGRRYYWTCHFRRRKDYKCMARLVTEQTSEGFYVRKISGLHNHNDHAAEIECRLKKLESSGEQIVESIDAPIYEEGNIRRQPPQPDDEDDDHESISCASPSSNDFLHFPQRIEDMRRTESQGDDDNIDFQPKSPERIDLQQMANDMFEVEGNTDALDITTKETITINSNSGKHSRKRKLSVSEIEEKPKAPKYTMDASKVSRLRSAKGQFLLCVDGFIYYLKNELKNRNYWICIKRKDPKIKCRSHITTIADKTISGGIKVLRVLYSHNHPVSEYDIKRRLCNELVARGIIAKKDIRKQGFLDRSLKEISEMYESTLRMTKEGPIKAKISIQKQKEIAEHCEPSPKFIKEEVVMNEEVVIRKLDVKSGRRRKMKLYAVSDGPPSLAVRMTLKALKIPFELVNVDYVAGEHMTEAYAKMNPQKEIPVLDDNGFYLSESIAIMQYLCDKYAPDNEIYPKDATARALVNHRLCFNMGFYYASISMHSMAPIFFDYPRNEMTLKKVRNALATFEKYLKSSGFKYAAAADHATIADYALVSATLCLEAIDFDLTQYPLVKAWYDRFKSENPSIWEIGLGGMKEIAEFEKNPPDLSHMNHPFHPTKTNKA